MKAVTLILIGSLICSVAHAQKKPLPGPSPQPHPTPTPTSTPTPTCKKTSEETYRLDGGDIVPGSNPTKAVCWVQYRACGKLYTKKSEPVRNAPDACGPFTNSVKSSLRKDVCCDCYPNCPNDAKPAPDCGNEKDLEDKILREMKVRQELLDLAEQRRQEAIKYTEGLVWPAVKSTITFGVIKVALGAVLKKYAAGAFPPVAVALTVVGSLETAMSLYELRDEWKQSNKNWDDTMSKWEELDSQIQADLDQLEACRKSKQSKSELLKISTLVLISTQEPQVDVPRIRAELAGDAQTIATDRNYPNRAGSSLNTPYYEDALKHLSAAIVALKAASQQLNNATGNSSSSAGKQQIPEGDPNITLTPNERQKLVRLVGGSSLLRAFDELSMAFDLARAQLEHDERVLQMLHSRPKAS